ncbi:MAG TPA: trehalose-phosphatase [Anaerolineales bacterium]|nr:trehalose-phosphatase [Anaerolineales bacterium]
MKFNSNAELTRWALGSQNLWLFLDYDGTLADFAPTPEIIETNPKVVNPLERLVHLPNIRVTVMSGRRLRDLYLLLPITGIFLAGTYGVELQESAGRTIRRVEYDHIRPMLEAIKPQWEQIINGRRGFFLEDKDWTLALHTRFADEHEAEQVLNQARQVARAYLLKGYSRILGGHQLLEIAPMLASKRETVAYLLIHYPLPDVRLLYIGDDDKDEEVFSMLHARHGMAVKVRQPSQASRPTEADFSFESPLKTLEWLEELI